MFDKEGQFREFFCFRSIFLMFIRSDRSEPFKHFSARYPSSDPSLEETSALYVTFAFQKRLHPKERSYQQYASNSRDRDWKERDYDRGFQDSYRRRYESGSQPYVKRKREDEDSSSSNSRFRKS